MSVGSIRKTGHRIIPKYHGHWDINLSYENLIFVDHEGLTYASKIPVPAGVEITNSQYWSEGISFNAQVESMRQECLRALKDSNNALYSFESEINGKFDLMLDKAKNDVDKFMDDSLSTINIDITTINNRINEMINNTNSKISEMETKVTTKLQETDTNIKSYLNQVKNLLSEKDNIINLSCNIPPNYDGDIVTYKCM